MRINYKEPYWVKYQWDLSNHHENQYVTEFNKTENGDLIDFIYNNRFTITCEFKIPKDYKRDTICAIFGKPGMNMGLTYNTETKTTGFEFWAGDKKFYFISFDFITEEDIENGVIATVIKDRNTISTYKNFVKTNELTFEGDFIDDYRYGGLYLGCGNAGTHVPEHRLYCEVDVNYFSIINNSANIEIAKDLYGSETHTIVRKTYYDKILCLYNFESINNIGVVYDESKNFNFLEKVPTQFIS